jgi:hypothetical protein
VRVNLITDLSLDDEGGYILRKEMLDDKCFQVMHAELRFDGKRRLLSRHIEGGEFIIRDVYETSELSRCRTLNATSRAHPIRTRDAFKGADRPVHAF